MPPSAIACLWLLLALSLGRSRSQETLAGPRSPAEQPQWLANITAARAATLKRVGYNDTVYSKYLPWSSRMYIAPQSHIYDRYLFNTSWSPQRFLDDLTGRYGGIDGVLLWATYPNIGIDERSQFDVLEDLPGGLDGFAAICLYLGQQNVRVGLPYNPWDTGTARRNITDAQVLAQLAVRLGVDFVNGDTMSYMDSAFFYESLKLSHPVALQPEGNAQPESLAWTKMGWGYWPAPYIPDVDALKWLEHRHLTQICNRWNTHHIIDLQQALFNGDGFVSWENVWGCWNGLSLRDSEAIRRVGALLRFLAPFLTSADWEPHAVLATAAADAGVFASRWPVAAGVAYAHNATAWTLVNRAEKDAAVPAVPAPCDGGGTVYFDLYHGVKIMPARSAHTSAVAAAAACFLPLPLEAMGFGAVLAVDAADAGDPALQGFLKTMAAMTAQPLASYSADPTYLPQLMTQIAPAVAASQPPATVLIHGTAAFAFAVVGTEIEGRTVTGNDVQYPWEQLPSTTHAPHYLAIPDLYWDVTPVTNSAYAAFLSATNYTPSDDHNFLRDWQGARQPPPGWDAKPVTWVDLLDARAYCAHYGKRLPNDWEWQFAAQGGAADQPYAWGYDYDGANVPPKATGTTRPPPPDVGSFPGGDTATGLKDMMGLVWQWTNEFADDHTRAGLVRGGSYYTAVGSMWYFPNDLTAGGNVRANSHNKILLMSPSYDRHGTVGFRCVADVAPSPAPPPPPSPAAIVGCADGTCDGFCRSSTVHGCVATWPNTVSLRASATGSACGGTLGPCTAPADACAPGWGLCLSTNSTEFPGLSADAFRAGLSADGCASSGSAYPWRFLGAMSHADLSWQRLPAAACPPGVTNLDVGCRATGWGSEAVCCGAGCTRPACANNIFFNNTLVHINQGEGCGAVAADDADGVLCCKLL